VGEQSSGGLSPPVSFCPLPGPGWAWPLGMAFGEELKGLGGYQECGEVEN